MPKERVPERLREDGHTEGIAEVSWNKETGGIQIVTYGLRPPTGERVFEGFYVDLDRGMCNALIRHLRRARDQAFGRDE